jgi:hypothetical protein
MEAAPFPDQNFLAYKNLQAEITFNSARYRWFNQLHNEMFFDLGSYQRGTNESRA